jgi:ribosomal protein S27AE
MRLTSDSTRVAIPHGLICPHCGASVGDWHLELFPQKQQQQIYNREMAMDCPNCGKGVWLSDFDLVPADPDTPLGTRSRQRLNLWLEGYPSDRDYLKDNIYGQYSWGP